MKIIFNSNIFIQISHCISHAFKCLKTLFYAIRFFHAFWYGLTHCCLVLLWPQYMGSTVRVSYGKNV